jgi:hypothetical protein
MTFFALIAQNSLEIHLTRTERTSFWKRLRHGPTIVSLVPIHGINIPLVVLSMIKHAPHLIVESQVFVPRSTSVWGGPKSEKVEEKTVRVFQNGVEQGGGEPSRKGR